MLRGPSAIPTSRPTVSRSISFRRLMASMPGEPMVWMRDGMFAELHQPPRRIRVAGEMQMRHLADGVTGQFIDCAFGDVAAEQMRHRQSHEHRGLRRRQHLETVAEHHDEIRLQPRKRVGKSDDAEPDRFGDADAGIAAQQRLDGTRRRQNLRRGYCRWCSRTPATDACRWRPVAASGLASAGSPASARPTGRNPRGCRSQSRFCGSRQSFSGLYAGAAGQD